MRFLFVFSLFIFACNNNSEQSENITSENKNEYIDTNSHQQEMPPMTSDYSFTTINGENGWGYKIFKGRDLLINQMHIPAVQGIKGFHSEKKASIVASYIITQIKNGNFPPTISKKELDSLGVLE